MMPPADTHRQVAEWVRLAAVGSTPRLTDRAVATLDALAPAAIGAVARDAGMAPWIVSALDSAGRSDVATDSGLRAWAMMQAMLGMRLDAELSQLAGLFAADGIQCIVLKGPAVAHRYYERPEHRPYGDLDVLIRDHDEPRVHAILDARGYHFKSGETREPLHHEHSKFQTTFEGPGGVVVDLHRDHLQIGLRPISLDDAWNRAVSSAVGTHVRLLDDNDQFVLLAVHLQRHGFERLLWFKDLDLMVRSGRLDWARVAEIADMEGCTSSVAYALSLLHDVLGTPLPPDAAALAGRRGVLTRVMQMIVWPREAVLSLGRRRRFRWRRITQFAPESGVLRGGVPGLLTWGRRGAKARVLLAALRGRSKS